MLNGSSTTITPSLLVMVSDNDHKGHVADPIAGITYTKCDNMASLDNLVAAREVLSIGADGEQLGKAVDIPSLRIAYKQAIIKAQRHFGSTSADRVIWCMEMTPRVLLGDSIGLPTSSVPKTRSVLRNSDDYYPDEPNSHRYHIFTNVVNALFVSQLNVVPDFDMVRLLMTFFLYC